ncbi:hypothetical protein FD13_GL000681 [Levilactobacillus senmaizukei DSM 21775 = NBRC 103853]|uniref:acylphosphatase n=1 Tax=Levilactobacillus senmaizukei DSM 21775 = NBRC 103853 TaxID=1423803 RepID=A0A0R2DCD9_9LACO|nr:acylphosphatase [Levilactobacillus senmaizukei]KRN01727.1 hypothetical protein FD13_GL000681 [Levilactobacillus senmaizukei DSM 21775 = NBRC 103853]
MLTQKWLISGRVQGVGFRWSAQQLANQLGVTGTVQNLRTGQVAIVVTGEREQLVAFTDRLQRGLTPWITVANITKTDLPVHHFADFQIII